MCRENWKASSVLSSVLFSFYVTVSVLFGILLCRMGMYYISLVWSFLVGACLFVEAKYFIELSFLRVGRSLNLLCLIPCVFLLGFVEIGIGESVCGALVLGWQARLGLSLCMVSIGLGEPGYDNSCRGWKPHYNPKLFVKFGPNISCTFPL